MTEANYLCSGVKSSLTEVMLPWEPPSLSSSVRETSSVGDNRSDYSQTTGSVCSEGKTDGLSLSTALVQIVKHIAKES